MDPVPSVSSSTTEPRVGGLSWTHLVAFSAGWFWLLLLVVAAGALSESARALGGSFVVAGCVSLGLAVGLSLAGAWGVRIPALAGLSLALVLASALAPVRLDPSDPLVEVGFGYPIRFVFADLSMFGDVAAGYGTVVNWVPQEDPARTDGFRLLASWFLVFGGLGALLWGLPAAVRRLAARVPTPAGARRTLLLARWLRSSLPVLGGLALGLVLASSLAPVAVGGGDSYARIGFGYPVRFLFADLTLRGSPVERRDVEYWDPTWDPTQVGELRLLASWLVVFVLLVALAWGVRAAWQRLIAARA